MRGNGPSDRTEQIKGQSRRAVLWAALALALCFGIVLYFRFEPHVAPLLGR